ncbi:MAG: FHA domain-containing protein [Nitrospirae bacterium]|nr:FHA domain-containing protein [Nitrospirota bacterium]
MNKPVPVLHPLTEEARNSITESEIQINKFPFRIGRQSRSGIINSGNGLAFDRRNPGNSPNNDCYLIDNGKHLNISREHIQIEKKEDDTYEIMDLNSSCGTTVDGHNIGKPHEAEYYPLKNGSIVVIGTPKSPYVFKFILPSG